MTKLPRGKFACLWCTKSGPKNLPQSVTPHMGGAVEFLGRLPLLKWGSGPGGRLLLHQEERPLLSDGLLHLYGPDPYQGYDG